MGQVWQLPGCRIEIGLVGRTLVHYRRLRGSSIRAPGRLISQQVLELELKHGHAVLLEEAAGCPPAGVLRIMKPRAGKSKKVAAVNPVTRNKLNRQS